MEIPAKLVKKVSEKSGKEYMCVELTLAPNYTKKIFLDTAELALLALLNNK